MPWTVLPGIERARPFTHETTGRIKGTCRDTIEAVIIQASALLRRRSSQDVIAVAAVITNAPHCVPCLTLLTHLDARRVYAALEQLKAEARARLVRGICRRCARSTTVHVIGE